MATDGPWHIDIRPWIGYNAISLASGVLRSQQNGLLGGGVVHNGSGVLNDYMAWDVPLTAGTWTVTLLHKTENTNGIYTLKLGTTTVGTIDGYSASATGNVASQVTGIAVGVNATVRFSVNMASKNGSSSGYKLQLQHISLDRTA